MALLLRRRLYLVRHRIDGLERRIPAMIKTAPVRHRIDGLEKSHL